MPQKALIAMSGGVDSSVAALLMQRMGYDCVGATMQLRPTTPQNEHCANSCGSGAEAALAQKVAAQLGIPHHVFCFSDRFEQEVIRRFAEAYENGRTPNPCVDCNRYLKFGALFEAARELGCDCIVTGHYARTESGANGRCLLKKAADPHKDQSYVLWSLSQEQLSHIRFPLGGLTKAEVRQIAAENGLVNADRPDSQDICFVPNRKYAEFLQQYTGRTYPEGDFVTADGSVLGRHKGIIRYTIGQKKGLGLVLPEPLYVCAVDPVSNTVTLGKEDALYARELTAHGINLISLPVIETPLRLYAKIRYRQQAEPAVVTQPAPDALRVVFDAPQRAITKGQSVVLYDGDTVVGGGIIA